MELHPNPSIRLIRAALTHDMAEAEVGDLPYTAKKNYYELGVEYSEAEFKKLYSMGLDHPDELEPEDRKWLAAADMLELLFFCAEEVQMGNRAVIDTYQNGLQVLHNMEGVPQEIEEVISELHKP